MKALKTMKSKLSGLIAALLLLSIVLPAGFTPAASAASDNLAAGATVPGGTGVGYSSQGTATQAVYAVDGKTATVWQPSSADRSDDSAVWFRLNLGSVKTFNKAVLQFATNLGVNQVKIQYSNDGSAWNDAYSAAVQNKGNNVPKTETVDFSSVSGQYVKVTFTLLDPVKNFQLSEFELYNIPTGPTEPAPVSSAFVTGGDGTATVAWVPAAPNAAFADAVRTIVTDTADSSRTVTVTQGVYATTFTGLTNGQPYTFGIQTEAGNGHKSERVDVTVVPSPVVYPNTLLINSGQLVSVKNKLATPGNTEFTEAVNTLRAEADQSLTKGPYSVMYKTGLAPSGDKHDYWSSAPYWWPDPTKPDGLPYINKDGQFNPEGYTNKYDKQNFIDLRDAVSSLSLAYYYTDEEKYAAKAAQLIRTWFVDPATRMNPNMNYAQGVPGAENGRKEGVLETDKLLDLIDDAGLISKSPSWSGTDSLGFKSWLSQYTVWLRTSQLAQDEKATRNNHSTWYDAQYVAYSMYLGNVNEAKAYLQANTIPRLSEQIMPDGTMPEELRRTRPFHYFIFNLIPFTMLAKLGDQAGVDVWNSGGSLRTAYDFITPYVVDFTPWPYAELEASEDERVFAGYLRDAAAKFGYDAYASAADIMLKDKLATHRANLVSPGGVNAAPRKELVTFSFQGLYVPVYGKIGPNDEIAVTVPKDTMLKSLVATLVSTGAAVKADSKPQVNGVTANDFTKPVVYTVVSPKGQTRNYTVKVNVADTRLPVQIYNTAFSEYRDDPRVDAGLAQNSSTTLFDVIEPLPQAAADIKPLTWYKGFYNNGVLVSPASVFVKDGNSQHTRSMPAAVRLTKDADFGSTVTINVPTQGYSNISGSFVARTQDKKLGYTINYEWSVDGGATWNLADKLLRDSAGSPLTDAYGNVPFTFAIGDAHADNQTGFLFRLRLDNASPGYVNVDDFQLFGAPLGDLSRKELMSFSFQGLAQPVIGKIKKDKIELKVPSGTDVTKLVAAFTSTGNRVRVGAKPQTSGVTANDFTAPVVYTVEAGDGSWKNYTVSVKVTGKKGENGQDDGDGADQEND